MDKTWSLIESQNGARTIEEITSKSKLHKSNRHKFNCSKKPLFPFIPIKRVIIDSLHLFLRISDVLINLLIRDLRQFDACKNTTSVITYRNFLNETCKIHFNWIMDEKDIKWHDLTGPEKHRLFQNIDIPKLFPIPKAKELQQLWKDFYDLIKQLSNTCDANTIEKSAKEWVNSFVSVYQRKDVTPYIHAFAYHVPQFLQLYDGNISIFSQQGLEKLNDITTKHFQRGTNHHDISALKQILQKHIRIQTLEEGGYQRKKSDTKCKICSKFGHNRRTCPERPSI